MNYRGYKIEKSGFNFAVVTPNGERWAELTANRATAKKWIDAHLAEQRHTKVRNLNRQPDVYVRNEGSIFLFTPLTDKAREWLAEYAPDDAQYMGRSLVVEHRFAQDIAAGMIKDGLIVK